MTILDWWYPKKCLGCGRIGEYLCSSCLQAVEHKRGWYCPECNQMAVGGKTHLGCQRKFSLDGLVGLLSYKGLVKLGVHSLKYRFLKDIETELAGLIQAAIRVKIKDRQGSSWLSFLKKKPVVIAVPLHWRRQNWRGFNQAEIVATIVADSLRLELMTDKLIRKQITGPQTKLNKIQRQTNVSQAFAIKEKESLPEKVLLIDDVWTTGATMKAAGKVLKRNGVREVWGLTLAR